MVKFVTLGQKYRLKKFLEKSETVFGEENSCSMSFVLLDDDSISCRIGTVCLFVLFIFDNNLKCFEQSIAK